MFDNLYKIFAFASAKGDHQIELTLSAASQFMVLFQFQFRFLSWHPSEQLISMFLRPDDPLSRFEVLTRWAVLIREIWDAGCGLRGK